MFGNDMLFQKELKISKKRLTIPVESGIEENDEIVLLRENNHLLLRNYKDLSKELQRLKRLKDQAYKKADLIKRQMYYNEYHYLALSIIKVCELLDDTKHRIILPTAVINEFNLNDKCYMAGLDDRAIVFSDVNDLTEYMKSLKISLK